MPHGKYSPSKAHRWITCPGSVQYDKEGPESSYAEEGSHAHRVLELVLKGNPVLTGEKLLDDNGKEFEATPERIQQAIEIRDFIARWKTQHPDFVIESETPIKVGDAVVMPFTKSLREEFDGTADMIGYSIEKQELVVLDAKFGFVRVEPKDNHQLYLYATGALNELDRTFDLRAREWSITVIIAQPDYEGVVQFREHRMTWQDLANWWDSVRSHIYDAASGGTTLSPSEAACRYCPGRFTCGPRIEQLKEFAKEEWRMTKTLGELLPMLSQVRKIADDLEAEAVRMLARGEHVPGYKLVESRSIRQWTTNTDVISAGERAGVPVVTTTLLSPAQVEKRFGKAGKIFTGLYAVTPKGGPKLAPDSDSRPEFKKENFIQEEIDEMLKSE